MKHPFDGLRPESRVRLMIASGVLVMAISTLMTVFGRGLTTDRAPRGGLSLQLAGDPIVAGTVMSGWKPAQLALAENLLVADYGFLVCYSMLLALACYGASKLWASGSMAALGVVLAWTQWLAALFDAIENAALLSMLNRALDVQVSTAPTTAGPPSTVPDAFVVNVGWLSTMAKWFLIEAGLAYIAITVGTTIALAWRARRMAMR